MNEQVETQDPVEPELQPQPEQRPSRGLQWIAPAWFLLGVLVGVAGLALLTTLSRPRADATALRDAARQGTLDAIATLQAGGSQPESSAASPGAPTTTQAFAVRDANRLGSKDAKVTIVEFSDFQ